MKTFWWQFNWFPFGINRGPVKKAAPCVITFATKSKKTINAKTCIKYKYSILITKEAKKSKLYKKLHIFIMVKKRKVKNSIRSLHKKASFLREKKQSEFFFFLPTWMTALNQQVLPTFFNPTGQFSILFLSWGLGESLHTSVWVRFRLALFSAMLASKTLEGERQWQSFLAAALDPWRTITERISFTLR